MKMIKQVNEEDNYHTKMYEDENRKEKKNNYERY